jgi:hypothetical protein
MQHLSVSLGVRQPHHWLTAALFVKVMTDRNVGELYCCQGFMPFWMWHRVVWWWFTDVSTDDGALETAEHLPDDTSVCYVTAQCLVYYCECGSLSQLLLSVQCCQFQHKTSCCTVQIHIQSAHSVLFRYTAGVFRHIHKIPECNYWLRHLWLSIWPST